MTDTTRPDGAVQVPLHELLRSVPQDARLVIDEGSFSTRYIPVGRYCHEAAAALATQHPSQSAGDFVPPHCDPDREDVFAEPTSQSAGEPVFTRSAIIEWLDGIEIDVTDWEFDQLRPASPPPTDAARASGDEPLTEFQEGQWWIEELDAMVKDAGTDDQKRAVAVVHHLLRASSAAAAEPDAARVEADRSMLREARDAIQALRMANERWGLTQARRDAVNKAIAAVGRIDAALAAERNHGIRPDGGEHGN